MIGTAPGTLEGLRILVVEDEFLIAEELAHALGSEGAQVLGPVPTVSAAQSLIEEHERIDGSVLDVDLRGAKTWPVMEALLARKVPIVLVTGCSAHVIPSPYAELPRFEKPVAMQDLKLALSRRIGAPRQDPR